MDELPNNRMNGGRDFPIIHPANDPFTRFQIPRFARHSSTTPTAWKIKIRQPENQVGRQFGPHGQRFAQKDKAVIDQHQHEGDGNAHVGFAPVHADSQWNADERKAETSEGKRNLPVHLGAVTFNQSFQIAKLGVQFRRRRARVRRQVEAFQTARLLAQLPEGHIRDGRIIVLDGGVGWVKVVRQGLPAAERHWSAVIQSARPEQMQIDFLVR